MQDADVIHHDFKSRPKLIKSDDIRPPGDSYRAILETAFDGYVAVMSSMDISEEYRLLDWLGSKYNKIRDRIIDRERRGGAE